jgi:hypothetical protein
MQVEFKIGDLVRHSIRGQYKRYSHRGIGIVVGFDDEGDPLVHFAKDGIDYTPCYNDELTLISR